MFEHVIEKLFRPTIRRLGSMLAGYLVSVGVAAEPAGQIATGAAAALAIGADLVLSHRERNK